MGPGNPPAVGVWAAETGQFGSRPVKKADPLNFGRPNQDPYPSTCGFCQVWLDPSVPISSSEFQVSHLWSHSDMLQIIVEYWHWYITVHFRCIGRIGDHNVQTHTAYHSLDMSVNEASTIVRRVSWVIWGATGYTVINIVVATVLAKRESEMLPTPSWKWVSTEHQRLLVLHLR